MVGREKCKKNKQWDLISLFLFKWKYGWRWKMQKKTNRSHFSFPLEQFMLKACRKQNQERQDQFLKSWFGRFGDCWILWRYLLKKKVPSEMEDRACTLSTLFILFTVFTLFTLFILFDTVYNALYRSYLSKCFTCLNSKCLKQGFS